MKTIKKTRIINAKTGNNKKIRNDTEYAFFNKESGIILSTCSYRINAKHLTKEVLDGFEWYKIINKLTRKELKKEISQLNSVITGLNSVLVKRSKEIEAYEQCYKRLMNINVQLTNALNSISGEDND